VVREAKIRSLSPPSLLAGLIHPIWVCVGLGELRPRPPTPPKK
jgi:hypothetical protein